MPRFFLVPAFLAITATAAQAQVAGLSLSGDLVAGNQVTVAWTGPGGQNDWVGLAEPGAAASSWVSGSWVYTNTGNPVTLTLPGTPGAYELRYVTGGSAILAAQSITVTAPATAADVTLQPTGALIGGAELSVAWTGPGGQGDWIGLAPAGAAASAWTGASYAYASAGNPARVPLPLGGGAYELRYVTAQNVVLAAIPINVIPGTLPSVALSAMIAPQGAALSVELGPDAPRAEGDYLYIAALGSGPQDYSGGYASVPASGPVAITAPADTGEWELRYVVTRGGTYIPVGSAPLTVVGPDYKHR